MSSPNSMGTYKRKHQYRLLLENVSTLDDNAIYGIETVEKTRNVVKEAGKLLSDGPIQEKVQHPGESLLDSRVLLATSEMATLCVENMSGNTNVYDPDELADHIRCNPFYWSSICLPNHPPGFLNLRGTFLPGLPAERPQRSRKKLDRQKVHTTEKPENITIIEKSEEDTVVVSHIKKLINQLFKKNDCKPLSFLHLVLDPDSFGRTIENIYHISFLVRDGIVAIGIDENTGLPHISPVSKDQMKNDENSSIVENNQFIFSLDMEDWMLAIKELNVSEALINVRKR